MHRRASEALPADGFGASNHAAGRETTDLADRRAPLPNGRQGRPDSVAPLPTLAHVNLPAGRQQRRHVYVVRELAVVQTIRQRICRAGPKRMSVLMSSPDASRA